MVSTHLFGVLEYIKLFQAPEPKKQEVLRSHHISALRQKWWQQRKCHKKVLVSSGNSGFPGCPSPCEGTLKGLTKTRCTAGRSAASTDNSLTAELTGAREESVKKTKAMKKCLVKRQSGTRTKYRWSTWGVAASGNRWVTFKIKHGRMTCCHIINHLTNTSLSLFSSELCLQNLNEEAESRHHHQSAPTYQLIGSQRPQHKEPDSEILNDCICMGRARTQQKAKHKLWDANAGMFRQWWSSLI